MSSCSQQTFFNAEFYVTHEVFKRTAELTKIPKNVLFPVALTLNGDKAIANSGSRIDAVKVEAVATCKDKEWGSLIHRMAIASLIRQPIYSLYPEVNFRFRPHSGDSSDKPIYFLWSRNLDNKPNVWYKPNHIVPVISVPPPDVQHADAVNTPAPRSTSTTQSSLSAFFKPPTVKSGAKRKCDHPTVLPEKKIKKSEEKVNVDDRKEVTPQKTSTNRKFLPQWQEKAELFNAFFCTVFTSYNQDKACS